MDKECKSYMKVCYKKSEQIYKCFYHIVFLFFSVNAEGFGSEEKVLLGRGDIKRF